MVEPPGADGYFDEPRRGAVRRVRRGDVRPGGRRPDRRLPRRARAGAGARSSSGSERGGSRCRSRSAACRVHGIELSRAMAARLRAKPGGDEIGVTIGDFATTAVEGTFTLAYLVFNTIGNLTTQEAQVACFRNAAAHLEPGGCFVIEVEIPDLQRAAARRDDARLPRGRDALGHRRVRRREAGAHLASLRARRRALRARVDAVPLRVAVRARPDGAARRA